MIRKQTNCRPGIEGAMILCIRSIALTLFMWYVIFLPFFTDPMLRWTAASYTVVEGAGPTMDICAEINNVLPVGSGTVETITVDVIVTAGTASMS